MARSRTRSPSRRIFSDSDSEDGIGAAKVTTKAKRGRQYRQKGKEAAPVLALDARAIAELDIEVQRQLDEAVQTDEVTKRIQDRLVKERARLEAELESKIADERSSQLLRKRREQEQRLQQQAELERILQENQAKLDAAKAQTDTSNEKPSYKADKMHSLNSHATELNGAQLAEDVVVLGGSSSRR